MSWEAKDLAPLNRPAREHEFLGLDTEDDQRGFGRGRGFYLGCIHGPQGGRAFQSRHDLQRWLLSPRWKHYWVACHNLEYDLLNIFGVVGLLCRGHQVYFSGTKLCAMIVQVGDKPRDVLTFFDTSSFLAEPLKKLAPLVNMEKIEMDIPRRGDRRVTPQRVEYCMKDAEIAYRLAGFIQDGIMTLGGQMKLTAASTALDLFRRKFLHESLPRIDERMQLDMHRGYSGGRVECFRLGEIDGPVFQNDINGAYVSVMINSLYPDTSQVVRKTRGMKLEHQGMVECNLTVPSDLWAGPLPSKGEKLTFPTGRLSGVWTYNELREAKRYGVKINKVKCCWESKKNYPYLKDMMISLRAIRENPVTPAPVSRMAKLLGNSLYGKFAQRNEEFVHMPLAMYLREVREGRLKDGQNYNSEKTTIYENTGVVRVVTGLRIPAHSNVIWSAITTAGCRGLLLPFLEKGDTFYCDTDSVIGYKDFPKTKKLGELAHQHSYSRVVIRGNKLYAGLEEKGWNAHAKGVPRALAQEAVLSPGKVLRSRRPVRMRSALAGKHAANEWIEVYKQLSGDYDKRLMLPGGETKPLAVKQW
jgi:hypothetical protein